MPITQVDIDAIPFSYDIRFVDSESSAAASYLVQEHLVKLSRIYDRITDCRVAIGVHHRQSHTRSFYAHIQLDVPGIRLAVTKEPEKRDRVLDVRAAIIDSFHRITRQLEDYIRTRRDLKVEAHPIA